MLTARAAGVVAGIAIDTCLQTQRVDIIHQGTHAIGKQFLVEAQIAVGIAPVPIAVVNVYVFITCLLQSSVVHRIGLLANQLLVDVQGKRVPRTPSHGGCALCVGSHGQCQHR